MRTEDFSTLTAELRALGGQRVWSLMVSLFGDLLLDSDQGIDGPTLSKIMDGLQIKPEATRVALHRLRNDGWIVSEKEGRIRRHRLSVQGRRESLAASPRIYAAPDEGAREWCMVVTKDTTDLPGFVALTPRVWLGPTDALPPPDALCLAGDAAPDWLLSEIEPEGLRQGYAALHQTLTTLAAALPTTLTPLERAVLRCLIVHNWRRLILKHPALPAALYPDDWPGHACHELVFDLLNRIPRPAPEEITDKQAGRAYRDR